MSRYIDADAILNRYAENFLTAQTDYAEGIRDVLHDIKHAPSIDIVRCKECKWQSVINDEEEGTSYYMCGIWAMPTDEDVFCSYGKRREQ